MPFLLQFPETCQPSP